MERLLLGLIVDENSLAMLPFTWVTLCPMDLLNFFHGLFLCSRIRPLLEKQHWLLSVVLSVFSCLIGGTVRYMLLGLRPPWLDSNLTVPMNVVCWLLINHTPRDFFYKAFNAFPVSVVIMVLEMAHKGRLITGAVDLVVKTIPGPSVPGVIIIGTLSGCAGTFYKVAVERLVLDKKSPTELSKPTMAIRYGFYVTLFYYLATDPHHILLGSLLSANVAKMMVAHFLIIHGVSTLFLGPFVPFPISAVERLASLTTTAFGAAGKDGQPKKET